MYYLKTLSSYFEQQGQSELAKLIVNCYPNTLVTTTDVIADNTLLLDQSLNNRTPRSATPYFTKTHVITGDIEAMWLRDSAAQVRPYISGGRTLLQLSDSDTWGFSSSKLATSEYFRYSNPYQRRCVCLFPCFANVVLQSDSWKEWVIFDQLRHGLVSPSPALELLSRWLIDHHDSAKQSLVDELVNVIASMQQIIEGLIIHQADLIMVDPYANAFRVPEWNRYCLNFAT